METYEIMPIFQLSIINKSGLTLTVSPSTELSIIQNKIIYFTIIVKYIIFKLP